MIDSGRILTMYSVLLAGTPLPIYFHFFSPGNPFILIFFKFFQPHSNLIIELFLYFFRTTFILK